MIVFRKILVVLFILPSLQSMALSAKTLILQKANVKILRIMLTDTEDYRKKQAERLKSLKEFIDEAERMGIECNFVQSENKKTALEIAAIIDTEGMQFKRLIVRPHHKQKKDGIWVVITIAVQHKNHEILKIMREHNLLIEAITRSLIMADDSDLLFVQRLSSLDNFIYLCNIQKINPNLFEIEGIRAPIEIAGEIDQYAQRFKQLTASTFYKRSLNGTWIALDLAMKNKNYRVLEIMIKMDKALTEEEMKEAKKVLTDYYIRKLDLR